MGLAASSSLDLSCFGASPSERIPMRIRELLSIIDPDHVPKPVLDVFEEPEDWRSLWRMVRGGGGSREPISPGLVRFIEKAVLGVVGPDEEAFAFKAKAQEGAAQVPSLISNPLDMGGGKLWEVADLRTLPEDPEARAALIMICLRHQLNRSLACAITADWVGDKQFLHHGISARFSPQTRNLSDYDIAACQGRDFDDVDSPTMLLALLGIKYYGYDPKGVGDLPFAKTVQRMRVVATERLSGTAKIEGVTPDRPVIDGLTPQDLMTLIGDYKANCGEVSP